MSPFMAQLPSLTYKKITHLNDQGLGIIELYGDVVSMRLVLVSSIVMMLKFLVCYEERMGLN